MNRGRRGPTPDELKLWREVAKSIAPIARGTRQVEKPKAAQERKTSAKATGKTHGTPVKPHPKRPPLAPYRPPVSVPSKAESIIDRRTKGRVARGRITIDARIDLHGMTQAAAHRRLITFLHDAQADGARLALVITGKGNVGARPAWGEAERGVLRRLVPQWLVSAELQHCVIGYGEAARHHGGGGALYVQIRRRRA
jgi:DNA-nicking Smr family endonuclease